MDQDQRIAELERRLAEVETTRLTPPPTRRGRRPRRTLLVVAALVAAVAGPGLVLAAHDFVDVATTNTFHGQISEMRDAGITAGCSPTQYCPDAPVTRGQMAAFLRRGLGRVADATFGDTLTTSDLVKVGEVQLKAGDVTGGTARVLVQAAVSAYDNSGELCACRVVWYLGNEFGTGPLNWALDLNGGGSSFPWSSVALSDVFVVETGVTKTYSVWATRTGSGDVEVYGHVTAMAVPFDGTGNAVDLSTSSGPLPDDPTLPLAP